MWRERGFYARAWVAVRCPGVWGRGPEIHQHESRTPAPVEFGMRAGQNGPRKETPMKPNTEAEAICDAEHCPTCYGLPYCDGTADKKADLAQREGWD